MFSEGAARLSAVSSGRGFYAVCGVKLSGRVVSEHLTSLPFRSMASQVQVKDSFVSVSQPIESTTLQASARPRA